MEPYWVKPQEIAARLGVTTAAVYKMTSQNRLPHVRFGRAVRIPRPAWEAWMAEQNSAALSVMEKGTARG